VVEVGLGLPGVEVELVLMLLPGELLEEVDGGGAGFEHISSRIPAAELWSSLGHALAEHCNVADLKFPDLQRQALSVLEQPEAAAAAPAQGAAQGGRSATPSALTATAATRTSKRVR